MAGYASIMLALCSTLIASPGTAQETDCVVQVFGTGLQGKGIHVEVNQNGFGCVQNWNKVVGSADFDGTGEAEVPLRLHTDTLGVCMVSLSVWVTLPYSCQAWNRSVDTATWGTPIGGQGSCRALQQNCHCATSIAAIPWIDMWCMTPSGLVFEGQAQEMKLKWSFPMNEDQC